MNPQSNEFLPQEKNADEKALEELKAESLQRIKDFYLNQTLKRHLSDYFGTDKVINKDTKQYLREAGVSKEYLANPTSVTHEEVEELLQTPEFQKDPEFIMEVVRLDSGLIVHADRTLKEDSSFLLHVIEQIGPQFLFSLYNSHSIKQSREALLAGIKKDAYVVSLAEEDFFKDKDFISQAIQANDVYRYLPNYVRGERAVTVDALRNGYRYRYDAIPEDLRREREISLMFAKNALSIRDLPEEFKNDEAFVGEVFSRENIMVVLAKDISKLQTLPITVWNDTALMQEIQTVFPKSDFYFKFLEEHYKRKII